MAPWLLPAYDIGRALVSHRMDGDGNWHMLLLLAFALAAEQGLGKVACFRSKSQQIAWVCWA